MENGLLLSFTQQQQQPISFFIFLPQPKTTHFHFITSFHHHHLRFSLVTTTTKSRKWDSNAETFRARNFNFNQEDDEEDEGEEEIFYGNVKSKRRWWNKNKKPNIKKKRSRNVLDEAIESIWIFKVFKSFGWFFPIILISFLLATGPKAFLSALAIPLVLSLMYLAFEKLWEKMQGKPKRRARMRRKTSSTYANSFEMGKEGKRSEGTGKAKMDNQFWVDGSNGPVNKGSQVEDRPNFGGWDYLDEAGSRREMPRETSQSQRTQEGTLSGSGRRSDTPLLVRLLLAIFPFIGFWAKMFW